jgi:hypothetical protein
MARRIESLVSCLSVGFATGDHPVDCQMADGRRTRRWTHHRDGGGGAAGAVISPTSIMSMINGSTSGGSDAPPAT